MASVVTLFHIRLFNVINGKDSKDEHVEMFVVNKKTIGFP